MFKKFSPSMLRSAIEIEMQKTDDVKLASELAIRRLKKDPDYYRDNFGVMEKAKPTKYIKRIPKATGKGYTYIYEEADKKEKKDWIKDFIGFFGFKDKKQAMKRVEKDYKDNDIGSKHGLTWDGWKNHLAEYFNNKKKWDTFFTKKPEKKDKKKAVKEAGKKKITEKKAKKEGIKLSVMKLIHGMYGTKPVVGEKKIEEKKEEKPKTIDTGNGSKIETNSKIDEKQKKEIETSDEIEAREGYFNEKPSEIMNVGDDVWGAARHSYDTYERFNVDISKMEEDGTALAYVTKKNLIGDYGLANTDERIKNGESEYKVLASFAVREYLKNMPDNTENSRSKYLEFSRAIERIDQQTTKSTDFFLSLAETFQNLFPQVKPEEKGSGMSLESIRKGTGKGSETIGQTLKVFLNTMSGVKDMSGYYDLNKKERKQLQNLKDIIDGDLKTVDATNKISYDKIVEGIIGSAKATGVKAKKGDIVLLTDNIKEKVYRTKVNIIDQENYDKLWEKKREVRSLMDIIYYSFKSVEDKREKFNKYFGTNFDADQKELAQAHLRNEINKIDEQINKTVERIKIYPEDEGQIIRAGKDSFSIAFPFPDDRVIEFKINAKDVKQEDVQNIKKDAKKKSTYKLNLFVDSQVTREGGKDFSDVSVKDAQKILEKDFNFRALQYGNSMPSDERDYHTKWTLQAFSDLSDILGIKVDQITANGKLGMAFGARGRGGWGPGAGAIAHYESDTKMINLTRANGFGSLAHEWGHFADNILSEDKQTFITLTPKTDEKTVNKDTIKHGSIFRRETKKRGKTIYIDYYYDENAPNKKYPFVKLANGETEPGKDPLYSTFQQYNSGQDIVVKEPLDIAYEKTAREIADKALESLHSQGNAYLAKIGKDNSNYELIKDMILESPYYNQKTECFARAFESYVADKLENNNRKNTYLSSKEKTSKKDGSIIYPQDEYRKEINKLFDKFFKELNATDDLKKAIDKWLKEDNMYIKRFDNETHQFIYIRKK